MVEEALFDKRLNRFFIEYFASPVTKPLLNSYKAKWGGVNRKYPKLIRSVRLALPEFYWPQDLKQVVVVVGPHPKAGRHLDRFHKC